MWVVDPIDGTTNFLRGFPVVGVSVALVEAGRPVVGAVNAPLLGASWSAAEGQGATDARGRRLSVSSHPGAGVVATGFPFRRKERLPRYLKVLEQALTRFEDLRRAGAASLDLAYVGAGVFDGFFELGLGIWDIAAGALLVREAGGVVTDWSGDPDAVFVSGDILAGTPGWHEVMLEIVAA
jgi:myo-inositol-1(or 4)-monophosphatase